MNKRRHFLRGSEWLAVGALVAVAAFVLLGRGSLFSPGPLSAQAAQAPIGGVSSHAALSGKCGACHAAPWSSETMADLCLKCHTDVARQITDPHTLHGMVIPPGSLLDCTQGCHAEHEGAGGALTLNSREATLEHFSKGVQGFSLKAHQTLSDGKSFNCASCHPKGLQRFDTGTCTTCHAKIDNAFTQSHIGVFGPKCLDCHDGVDTYGKAFDHGKVDFPLTGSHVGVDCVKCHQGARTTAALRAAPQDCYSCHKADDQHKGTLGTDCAACHTAADWKKATVDHAKTSFPLTGKHATTSCDQCHASKVYKGTPSDCYSCHKGDDKHNGGYGPNCASCHNTSDWKQATIDHAKTAFSLTGAHAKVACEKCHVNAIFKGTPSDCYSCHKGDDKHKGSYGTACASCHNTSDWKQATIDHSKTAFPLTGKHVTTACNLCHVNSVFKGTPKDCYSCHRTDDAHKGAYGTSCGTCHSTTAWKPASFNHATTAFPLTGAHVRVACTSCHVNNVYKGTPKDCYSCHARQDVHRGRNGTNCARCHNTYRWGD